MVHLGSPRYPANMSRYRQVYMVEDSSSLFVSSKGLEMIGCSLTRGESGSVGSRYYHSHPYQDFAASGCR